MQSKCWWHAATVVIKITNHLTIWTTGAYPDTSTRTSLGLPCQNRRNPSSHLTVSKPETQADIPLPCTSYTHSHLVKKRLPNNVRKSCIPQMWLWQCLYKAVQKLVFHVCLWQWNSTAWWGPEVTCQDGTSGYFRTSTRKVHFWLSPEPASPPWQGSGLEPAVSL